ncbi:hypothetical protein OH807_23175 [Kitasatospora sp. NBC_01560]|uniref:hypothetical protein n=1 Tax=Kitasatospora sp. NBC_01560 TaxID=2975965 RepID=UPI00386F81A1
MSRRQQRTRKQSDAPAGRPAGRRIAVTTTDEQITHRIARGIAAGTARSLTDWLIEQIKDITT